MCKSVIVDKENENESKVEYGSNNGNHEDKCDMYLDNGDEICF
jgi:hypothetical protein